MYDAFGYHQIFLALIKLQVNKSINKQQDISLRQVMDVMVTGLTREEGKNVRLMGNL